MRELPVSKDKSSGQHRYRTSSVTLENGKNSSQTYSDERSTKKQGKKSVSKKETKTDKVPLIVKWKAGYESHVEPEEDFNYPEDDNFFQDSDSSEDIEAGQERQRFMAKRNVQSKKYNLRCSTNI